MEAHKKWVIDTFDRIASDFGEKECTYFDYFGQRLVEFSHLSPTDHVLDVATGKGAVLIPANQKLGPQGKIIGIDLSQQMLLETRKKCPDIDLLVMDAEHLQFPNQSFDVVLCGFALYFFSSAQTALSEFKRVLKPGGRVAVSSFGTSSSLTEWTLRRSRELGAEKSIKIDPLNHKEDLRKLLIESGFQKVEIIDESKTFSFKNVQSWWDSLWTHGVRAQLEQLSKDKLEILRQEAFAQATHIFGKNSINICRRSFYGLGSKN